MTAWNIPSVEVCTLQVCKLQAAAVESSGRLTTSLAEACAAVARAEAAEAATSAVEGEKEAAEDEVVALGERADDLSAECSELNLQCKVRFAITMIPLHCLCFCCVTNSLMCSTLPAVLRSPHSAMCDFFLVCMELHLGTAHRNYEHGLLESLLGGCLQDAEAFIYEHLHHCWLTATRSLAAARASDNHHASGGSQSPPNGGSCERDPLGVLSENAPPDGETSPPLFAPHRPSSGRASTGGLRAPPGALT